MPTPRTNAWNIYSPCIAINRHLQLYYFPYSSSDQTPREDGTTHENELAVDDAILRYACLLAVSQRVQPGATGALLIFYIGHAKTKYSRFKIAWHERIATVFPFKISTCRQLGVDEQI